MEEWHYAEGGERGGPVSELDLMEKFRSGSLSVKALVWKDGMESWLPAESVLSLDRVGGEIRPASPSNSEDTGMAVSESVQAESPDGKRGIEKSDAENADYKDPGLLSWITISLFCVGTMVEILAVILSFWVDLYSEEFAMIDGIVLGLSLSWLLIHIAGIVFYCLWKYRVARNVYAANASWMTISPGYAVGYYFIPIMNLGMPMAAMREIWNATFGIGSGGKTPALVVVWWTFWILLSVTNVVARQAARLENFDVSMGADVVASIFTLVALWAICMIIRKVTMAQADQAGQRGRPIHE